jgi:hypothetical protein
VALDVPCELSRDNAGLKFILRITPTNSLPEFVQSLLGQQRSGPVSVTPRDYFEIDAITSQGLPVRLLPAPEE